MLVLGGGGYKISNVARCWAYETGTVLGACLLPLAANPQLDRVACRGSVATEQGDALPVVKITKQPPLHCL